MNYSRECYTSYNHNLREPEEGSRNEIQNRVWREGSSSPTLKIKKIPALIDAHDSLTLQAPNTFNPLALQRAPSTLSAIFGLHRNWIYLKHRLRRQPNIPSIRTSNRICSKAKPNHPHRLRPRRHHHRTPTPSPCSPSLSNWFSRRPSPRLKVRI